MECQIEANQAKCNCTYEPCSRKGKCCDCIAYHLIRCHEEGSSEEEIVEAFSVALIVGGSIVIPHLRRGVELMDQLKEDGPVP